MIDLSDSYFDTVKSIVQSAPSDEQWREKRDFFLSMNIPELFVEEICTIKLQGTRGSGHTHFALKMLDSDMNCVVFTYNDTARINISNGRYTIYNSKRRNHVLDALDTLPSIIIEDSTLVDSRIVNKYILGSDKPIFRVMVGHICNMERNNV